VIAAVILGATWLHSPPMNYEQLVSGTPRQGAVSHPTVIEKQSGEDHGLRGKMMEHLADWFVAAFTAVVALFTGLLVNATIGLQRSTDKLWEAGERQMAVAKVAADAAAASAEVADRSLKITQRAYIGVEPDGIRPHRRRREDVPSGGPTDVSAHFFIKNVGQLPARELNWFVTITFDQDRLWKPPQELGGYTVQGDNMAVTPGTRMRRATGRVRSTQFMRMDGMKIAFAMYGVRFATRTGLITRCALRTSVIATIVRRCGRTIRYRRSMPATVNVEMTRHEERRLEILQRFRDCLSGHKWPHLPDAAICTFHRLTCNNRRRSRGRRPSLRSWSWGSVR
jgi:hypothetical protein